MKRRYLQLGSLALLQIGLIVATFFFAVCFAELYKEMFGPDPLLPIITQLSCRAYWLFTITSVAFCVYILREDAVEFKLSSQVTIRFLTIEIWFLLLMMYGFLLPLMQPLYSLA